MHLASFVARSLLSELKNQIEKRLTGKRECIAETGRVGVVVCSTLTEWRVRGVTPDLGDNGSRSIDGGAEARPDGVF